MFRAFFKNITNLNGEMLGSAELKVGNGNVNADLLSKQTSTFDLVSIPPLIENGNVIGIYDDYGQIAFTGIISAIEGQTVRAEPILGIFDDMWRYYDPVLTTIEDCVEDIIETDFQGSSDTLVASIFNQFTITKTTTTEGSLGLMGNNYTVNFFEYLISLYNTYNILVDIYIPPSNGQATISIGRPNFDPIKVGNNTNAIRNIDITREVQETNRLIVYDGYGLLRGIWYATPSGITQDASALDRITKVKTAIAFSDLEDLTQIINENLSEKMYNHKITCELMLKNNLYNYRDFKLGTEIQVFFDGEYYDSILTGYSYNFDNRGIIEYMKLTMGKVRYSLQDKLQAQKEQIGQIANVQNEQVYVKQYVDREVGSITSTVASVQDKIDGNEEEGIVGLVSKVSSLEETDSNIIQSVSETNSRFDNYAQKTYVDDKVSTVTTSVNGLRVEVTDVQSIISGEDGLVSKVSTLSQYMEYENGVLRLGIEGSTILAELTPSELDFNNGGETKAWIGLNGLGTPKLSVGDKATQGNQWVHEVIGGSSDNGLFYAIHRHAN